MSQHIHDDHMEHKCLSITYQASCISFKRRTARSANAGRYKSSRDISDQEETPIWVPKLGNIHDRLDAMPRTSHAAVNVGIPFVSITRAMMSKRCISNSHRLGVRAPALGHYRYGLTGLLHLGRKFLADQPFENVQPDLGAGSFCLRVTTLSFTP